MKTKLFLILIFLLVPLSAFATEHLRLATTTSTENSGLLAAILPPFEKAHNCKIDVIAVGTGKAIKLGEAGDVDVVMVHARAKEDKFVANGFGVDRRDLMYNDFVLVGPASDPAGVTKSQTIASAMKAIAKAGATFVSRGDDSGTHSKEKFLWKSAGTAPAGAWYLEAGRGMGEVITMASERRGYTLSDRATYLAMAGKVDLVVVSEGDKALFNPYGVIMVNPKRHPHVNVNLAQHFMDYLTGAEGQAAIAGFSKNGKQLFFTYEK
ncbi:MAG: tungsten ABC transporter substrate-binding protein [Desulfuromonas sp.]|nr:MAG: tungsten ABC transporter substrate-binding protein [Desulfuromonas sp.]